MTSSRTSVPAPRRRPRHARPDLITLVRWSRAVQWSVVGVAAAVGSVIAFGYGAGRGAVSPVAPPTAAEAALVAPGAASAGLAAYPVTGRNSDLPIVPGQPSVSEGASSVTSQAEGLAADGIPRTALSAYDDAAAREAARHPDCRLPWELLAAIGRVESDHGRAGGATLYADGLSAPPIIGIALDGNGTALIRDTDGGALDGDTRYDHAVGPMQFIPSTWRSYGVDGDADGKADPFDVFDAAAAAGDYLCAVGGDLSTGAGQRRAVAAYNHSDAYVELVLQVESVYSHGSLVFTPPVGPVTPPPGVPPVAPGPPLSTGPGSSPTPSAGHGSPTATASGSGHPTSTSPSGSCPPAPSTSTSAGSAPGTDPASSAPVATDVPPTDSSSTSASDSPSDSPTDAPTAVPTIGGSAPAGSTTDVGPSSGVPCGTAS